ncbi:hypothetical protein BH09ACT10_BH09ACT10_23780 [soil metagenome]
MSISTNDPTAIRWLTLVTSDGDAVRPTRARTLRGPVSRALVFELSNKPAQRALLEIFKNAPILSIYSSLGSFDGDHPHFTVFSRTADHDLAPIRRQVLGVDPNARELSARAG